MNTITQPLKITALALALSFGLSYVYAWTAPTATPPAGNTATPIDTSASVQYKAGPFGVGGFFHGYSDLYVDGNVGIGTTTPMAKLEVAGNIIATGTGDVCNGAGRCLSSGVNMQVFTSSGTFTVPSGVTKIRVDIVGGGGGGGPGGNSARGSWYGAGGGGGGWQFGVFTVTPGTSYTVPVGAGGAGSTSLVALGAAGGASLFGSFLQANGGGAGAFAGIGGTASGGSGDSGGSGSGATGGSTDGPYGGSGSSRKYGAGGNGAAIGSYSGAAGANGIVVVQW